MSEKLEKKTDKKCSEISHPNLMPGWGCCQCRTYNGNHREQCKTCSHKRCFYPKMVIETVPALEDIEVPPIEMDPKKLN